MNSWDIDPHLYLPLLRSAYRALRVFLRRLISLARGHAAPPARCRG